MIIEAMSAEAKQVWPFPRGPLVAFCLIFLATVSITVVAKPQVDLGITSANWMGKGATQKLAVELEIPPSNLRGIRLQVRSGERMLLDKLLRGESGIHSVYFSLPGAARDVCILAMPIGQISGSVRDPNLLNNHFCVSSGNH